MNRSTPFSKNRDLVTLKVRKTVHNKYRGKLVKFRHQVEFVYYLEVSKDFWIKSKVFRTLNFLCTVRCPLLYMICTSGIKSATGFYGSRPTQNRPEEQKRLGPEAGEEITAITITK